MEANSTVKGITIGISFGVAKIKNLMIIKKSRSFPANSDINNQTVCKMNIKNKITNTEVNVIKKDLSRYRSRIFIRKINPGY
ncbi:hypothetical protein Pf1_00591 [Flavobacterium columnare]|nr:hypothetical protein Pf1_00591 [Flavobacterium columnare]